MSMSIDAVSKNNQSILGIYIQFIHNGTEKFRCIGMKTLTDRHTGKYLCAVTEECMREYDLSPKQVISITTDNASNMKTLVKNLDDASAHEHYELSTDVQGKIS